MDRPLRFSRSSPQLDSVDPSISRRSLLPDLGSVPTNGHSSSPLDLNHDNDGKDSLAEPVDLLTNGLESAVFSAVDGVASTAVSVVTSILGGLLDPPSSTLIISLSLPITSSTILPITTSIFPSGTWTSTPPTFPTTPPPAATPPTSSLYTTTSQNTDSASDIDSVVTSTSTLSTEASMSRGSLTSLSLTVLSVTPTLSVTTADFNNLLGSNPSEDRDRSWSRGSGTTSGWMIPSAASIPSGGSGGEPDSGGPQVTPTGSPSPTDPTYPPGSPPSLPPAKKASFALGTLVLFIVFGAGLFWWKKRQNKNGVNMFGRRLELGETPDAWNRLEEGGGGGHAEVEKNNNTKEASRTGNDMGYGTMQRGGVSIHNSFPPEERRRKKLPIITPILTWMKSRTRPGTHGAKEKYGTNSRTLPRSGRTLSKRRRRQSLSPVSLPSSSNTSLRSGSYISSDENDISLYMHVMHDDDSLSIPSPEPSPRSLSMSTGSRLSRISGSTNEVSEFEAVPGGTGGRKRRDSEHSSISEETSDTRSSFGFVRPVVSATGGAGPSTFTATGHYSTGNGSTTTLTSSSPPPASDPGGSNLSSPYGPGLDFFTARAWKKHPTAGPSLMEVVSSLSTPGGDNHGGMRPVSRGNNNQNPL